MLIGKPVFTGKTTLEQIEVIIALVGKPKQEDVDAGVYGRLYAATMLQSMRPPESGWEEELPEEQLKARWEAYILEKNASALAPAPVKLQDGTESRQERDDQVDLLSRLMCFNPMQRLTVQDGLEHPYVSPFKDPDTEGVAPQTVTTFNPATSKEMKDDEKFEKNRYRGELRELIKFGRKSPSWRPRGAS